MAAASHNSAFPVEEKAPLMGYHVDKNIVTLPGNRLVSVIRLKGVSFETKDKQELDREFIRLNRYFLALGKKEGKNLMVQTYTTKSVVKLDAEYKLPLPTLQDLVDTYCKPFRNGKFRQVGYTITLILKYRDLEDGISRMKELLTMSDTMLASYDPSVLGIESSRDGKTIRSQIGRFYSYILNGKEKDILLCDTRLGDAVIDSVTNFEAYDFVENRPNQGGNRFATTYDLRDYPTKSVPGMWDEAIEQQFDFTLVQSFLFEDRNEAKRQFTRHAADLASTEGESNQTDELTGEGGAVQQITQGEKAFGRYHASLIVYGETPDEAIINGSKMESLFMTHDTGFVRSTVTNIDTWFTQFPAVTKAIYIMLKSTENLCCGFSLHATPVGKATGNPIGDGSAIMPLRTVNESLYFSNLHDSPLGQNNIGEFLPGHKTYIGSTGTGKTTMEALELVFVSRFNPMLFSIDYNHSLENIYRALNTRYFTISPGEFTGINLFQLPDTPELRQQLFDTVLQCAVASITTREEEREIQDSIDAVLRHANIDNRGMSLLLQNIPKKGGNCLHTRLEKWCRHAGGYQGNYAWVLDSPKNLFNPTEFRRLAFDCTKILTKEFTSKHPVVMEVLLNTFFFLKRLMHKQEPGSLLINNVAEFWVPLSFESTAEAIKEILKAGRTRGECLIMDTQSPEDALDTEYAPAVVQQVITQFWLANNKADGEKYAKFGVKGKEFEKVVEIIPQSREFLIKQGHQAVMAKFVLDDNLKYWLPLLSSTEKNLVVAENIRKSLNTDDPEIWVPAFLDEMYRLNKEEDED
jgi:type IV secretion system protein VirB4